MMKRRGPRVPPRLVAGYMTSHSPKTYRAQRGVYYAIAKQLVLDKYPPWLHDGEAVRPYYDRQTWTPNLIARRADRAFYLFTWRDMNGRIPDNFDYSFDARRWEKFVRRVSRFIEFFDSKAHPSSKYSDLTDLELHERFEKVERWANLFMDEGVEIRNEKERRAALAPCAPPPP